jgi:hypothetical protein
MNPHDISWKQARHNLVVKKIPAPIGAVMFLGMITGLMVIGGYIAEILAPTF